MIKKSLIMFVILLLLTIPVYAQDYAMFSGRFHDLKEGEQKIDFEFYNGTYHICESEEKSIPILIVNKDAKTDNTYSLDVVGASWITPNTREFSLAARQKGVVLLGLKPWQNANGMHSVIVSATSSAGKIRKELMLDINVEKCFSLSMELEKEQDKVCSGTKKQYTGKIANSGRQKIDVELDVNGPNWIDADENIFSLDFDEKRDFRLNADVPPNAKGFFNVIVRALAKNLQLPIEKKLSIEVVHNYDCFKAEFIADESIENHYSNSYASVKIRNNGLRQAAYEISLEAPNWASAEPKTLALNPKQTGNLNLNINPSMEIPEGAYSIKLNAKSDGNVYSKNFNVVLKKRQFPNSLKLFFAFYQYYGYTALFAAIVLFIFRKKISNKIKNSYSSYKSYKTRKARLKALKAARKALEAKRELKTKKSELKREKARKYNHWILFFIVLVVAASALFLSIYRFDFPAPKNAIKENYAYIAAGILISFFIIFLIEFYKPMFKLLKDIGKIKKKK
ncbi:hypothetical protein HYY70_01125 [Candidatus Woesearchaeota archaeon]|nr:hypothetical protein [Candidatus Woesearchaeota archaeon]